MKMTSALLAALMFTSFSALYARVEERPIPRVAKKDGHYALLVDDVPYLMLGAQVHNSNDWPSRG
jgi:hypothetical protein